MLQADYRHALARKPIDGRLLGLTHQQHVMTSMQQSIRVLADDGDAAGYATAGKQVGNLHCGRDGWRVMETQNGTERRAHRAFMRLFCFLLRRVEVVVPGSLGKMHGPLPSPPGLPRLDGGIAQARPPLTVNLGYCFRSD